MNYQFKKELQAETERRCCASGCCIGFIIGVLLCFIPKWLDLPGVVK